MQPRTLDAILAELNTIYEPQIQNIRAQQQLIPQQTEADIAAARSAQSKAYEDILSGARQRGLAFSGIPLSEQAKYASNVFAPSVLAAQQRGREQALGLEQAILGVQEKRGALAQQLRQQEMQQAEAQRQFNEQLAEQRRQFDIQQEVARSAARAKAADNFRPTMDTSNQQITPRQQVKSNLPKISKTDQGFNFFDQYGKPITAAQYVNLQNFAGNKVNYRDLLQQMASSGDVNAKEALKYVGNDFRFGSAPESARGALTALGAIGNFQQARPQPTNRPMTVPQNAGQVLGVRSIF